LSIGVVVDSASNIPAELLARHGIDVVPMILKFGDRLYRDGVDIVPADFYEMLVRQRVAVSTSGPSAADFRDVFARSLETHEGVVCVTVASVVSVTYASAALAAAEFGDRVRVVDSRSASLAEGFVGIEAARRSQTGGSLDDVESHAKAIADRALFVATIETFEYLRRSGRVNAVKAFAATTLNVKPVFALRRGSVEQLGRPRARSRAVDRLIEEAARVAEHGELHAGVVHAAAREDADALVQRIRTELSPVELLVSEFTPLMGAHTGPGLLGIACWA
jgi:fatty acid kinase fatty acid binding subunit